MAGRAAADALQAEHRTLRLQPIGGRPHPPVITSLALSPDQSFLAAAGDDHAIRLIDTTRYETLHVLTAHRDWVRDVRFAPDGTALYSAGTDGRIIRWRRDEGWAPEVAVSDAPPISCMCLCPSGREFAAVGLQPFAIVAKCAGPDPRRIELGTRDLRCVRFSPDGQVLVAGGRDGALRWIDPRGGGLVMQRDVHRGRIRAAIFLDQGRTIASAGEDGHVVLVDRATGETKQRIALAGTKLLCLTALPGRRLVAGGTDNFLRILDLERGTQVASLAGHTGSVAALTVSHSALFSAGYDTTIRVWTLSQLPYQDRVARQPEPEYRTSETGQDNLLE